MNKLKLLLILSSLAMAGCSSDKTVSGGSGLIETDEITISAEVAGRVEKINFDEGDFVSSGDTLLVIDPNDFELRYASVEASLGVADAKLQTAGVVLKKTLVATQFAETERNRIAMLVKSGTASQKQLDQLEHELTQAKLSEQTALANMGAIKAEQNKIKSELDIVQSKIDDCHPVTSHDGTVVEKYISAGETISAGKAIARLADLNSLWVKIYLPTELFAKIKIGDAAKVDTESGEQEYQGVVVWTSSEAEFTPKNVQTEKSRANLVYAVKVKIDNSDGSLKIGMPVYVTFE